MKQEEIEQLHEAVRNLLAQSLNYHQVKKWLACRHLRLDKGEQFLGEAQDFLATKKRQVADMEVQPILKAFEKAIRPSLDPDPEIRELESARLLEKGAMAAQEFAAFSVSRGATCHAEAARAFRVQRLATPPRALSAFRRLRREHFSAFGGFAASIFQPFGGCAASIFQSIGGFAANIFQPFCGFAASIISLSAASPLASFSLSAASPRASSSLSAASRRASS